MAQVMLTALFERRADANAAMEELALEVGIDRGRISVLSDEAASLVDAATSVYREDDGFFAAVTKFLASQENHTYADGIRRGGMVVTIKVDDGRALQAKRAAEVLQRHGAACLDAFGETSGLEFTRRDIAAPLLGTPPSREGS
jgi:hypothetical protein